MRRLSLVLIIIALMIVGGQEVAASSSTQKVSGNLIKITSNSQFSKGTLKGAKIDKSKGDGAVVLSGGKTGTFTSSIMYVKPFQNLVASWNADTPAGTDVEVSARVYVTSKKKWSGWISWGKWSQNITRASKNPQDSLAQISTDTLGIKSSAGKTASRVQLKAVLHSNNAKVTPTLRQVTATYKNGLSGQKITPTYDKIKLPSRVKLKTPAYSQITRESSIANIMCSGVTMCTLLNDRGENKLPEEVSLTCYDYKYKGFGNWSYTIAAAGAYGYDAFVQYGDLNLLRNELAKGYSVGISVAYASSPGQSNPYLQNGASKNTNGHLITITGYEKVNGVNYFFSSDSAASSDKTCVRRYRADQLDKAWKSRAAYIVHKKEANPRLTGHVAAKLQPVKNSKVDYMLYANGKAVRLNKAFITSKLRFPNRGIIAYYKDGSPTNRPSGAKVTTANKQFKYNIGIGAGGSLRIKPESVLGSAKSAKLHVFVMVNNGVTYKATVNVKK